MQDKRIKVIEAIPGYDINIQGLLRKVSISHHFVIVEDVFCDIMFKKAA